jgi:hypothetical protein
MGVLDVIHYLARKDPKKHGYSGPSGGGPWIEPSLSVWWRNIRSATTPFARRILQEIEDGDHTVLTASAAADLLEEEGFSAWSARIRLLPKQRIAFKRWMLGDEDEDFDVLDNIPWRFAPGWRKRYRDIPRLGNVTH